MRDWEQSLFCILIRQTRGRVVMHGMFVRESATTTHFVQQRLKQVLVCLLLIFFLSFFFFFVIQQMGSFGANVKILHELWFGKSSVPATLLLLSNLSEDECPYCKTRAKTAMAAALPQITWDTQNSQPARK